MPRFPSKKYHNGAAKGIHTHMTSQYFSVRFIFEHWVQVLSKGTHKENEGERWNMVEKNSYLSIPKAILTCMEANTSLRVSSTMRRNPMMKRPVIIRDVLLGKPPPSPVNESSEAKRNLLLTGAPFT
jgi:hypothetical protein